MYDAAIIFLGLVGAAMGSFVGAMTWRMRHEMDFVRGRSECEHCHHVLSAFDLIPIFSWLLLRGRCRYCHKKIGTLTLWLELAMAAVFIISFIYWPLGQVYVEQGMVDGWQVALFILWLVMAVMMMALLIYDYRWRTLPNRIMFLLMAVTAVFSILNNIFIQDISLLNYILTTALGMLPVAGVYGLIYVCSGGRLIGFGDVKFGVVVGLLFGWQGALLVLVIANVLGSLVSLPMLVSGKMKMNSQMAFGPFLIVATYIVFLFQQNIITFLTENLLLL